MRILYAIIAEKIIVSQQPGGPQPAPQPGSPAIGGKLSFIDVIDEVTFNSPLSLIPDRTPISLSLSYAVRWEADDLSEAEAAGKVAKFWVETPHGIFIREDVRVEFQGKLSTTTALILPTFVYGGEGAYHLVMELAGAQARAVLTIKRQVSGVNLPSN